MTRDVERTGCKAYSRKADCTAWMAQSYQDGAPRPVLCDPFYKNNNNDTVPKAHPFSALLQSLVGAVLPPAPGPLHRPRPTQNLLPDLFDWIRLSQVADLGSNITSPNDVEEYIHQYIFCVPPKDILKSHPRPHHSCETDLIWKWGLCRYNLVKMRSCWSRNPTSNDWSSYKGKRCLDTETEGRSSCDSKGRDWSDASTTKESQGLPAMPDAGRGPGRASPRASRGCMALPNLNLHLLASRTVRMKACCFKPLSLWYFVMTVLEN